MSMIANGSWSALLIALAMTSAVVAQAQAPDPKGCTPQERSSQALNQGADKNAGVICPPDIEHRRQSGDPAGEWRRWDRAAEITPVIASGAKQSSAGAPPGLLRRFAP